MGLFVCWSHWEPPEPQLIYPAHLPGPVLERWISSRDSQRQSSSKVRDGGSDDFLELSPHRREEGLQRVAWKQVARGRGWLAKRFETDAEAQLELALDPLIPMEQGLSHLCARILELQREHWFGPCASQWAGVAYGHGKAHKAALSALALMMARFSKPFDCRWQPSWPCGRDCSASPSAAFGPRRSPLPGHPAAMVTRTTAAPTSTLESPGGAPTHRPVSGIDTAGGSEHVVSRA